MLVLLIEDDVLVGKMVSRKLARRGHKVEWVLSTRSAESTLSSGFAPDLIISDRDVLDGDAWAWLATRKPNARIVYMTGRPSADPPKHFRKGEDAVEKLWEMIDGSA